MKPEDFNLKEFRHSIILYTNCEDVFQMVSTSGGLEKWFLGKVVFNRKGRILGSEDLATAGDEYEWHWLTKDYSTSGTVIASDRLSVSYTFGNSFSIKFSVEADGNRSRLELLQHNLLEPGSDNFPYINCCVCWVFFLTNLKSVIEHGIDLRETQLIDESFVNQ